MAADVSLAWDASTSPNIASYKIYYGVNSGTYTTTIPIGNQTTYTLTGIPNGTYYFAVTAVDSSGNESGFSNEVSETIDAAPCDVNGDGSINVLDLQEIANAVLGLIPSSSVFDVNLDGLVNALDLQYETNVILGVRSCQ